MDASLFEILLHEEEDVTLDFKKEQYRFVKASLGDKSELLKDLVRFANGLRRTDRWWLHLPVRSNQDDHLAYHLEEPANGIQHFGDALEAIERLHQVLAALD
jgi:hypothetical protein